MLFDNSKMWRSIWLVVFDSPRCCGSFLLGTGGDAEGLPELLESFTMERFGEDIGQHSIGGDTVQVYGVACCVML